MTAKLSRAVLDEWRDYALYKSAVDGRFEPGDYLALDALARRMADALARIAGSKVEVDDDLAPDALRLARLVARDALPEGWEGEGEK